MKTETKIDKNYHSIKESKQIYFSFIKGLKINFYDESNKITFEGSIYTGSEKVLINNQIVSKKRTFRRKTKHNFQFNQNEYVIKFKINSIIKFTWTCSIFKNGELIKEFECKNAQNEQRFHKKHSEAIYGGLTGFAFALGYISLYTVIVIVIIGTIFSLWYMKQFLLVNETFKVSN
ncbi:MAG: hypothetical protein EA390_03420 [Balneolaceae bacterium]|nr:MAG: hypothetical protein EA390_03420 [Balneolaceae bacterium]